MPTYVYRREDGSTFEIEQRITADPLKVDPETGQTVQRLITGSAGLIFKGSGFYLTDYARKSGNGDAKSNSESPSSSESESSKGSSERSESEKPATTESKGSSGGTSKE